MSLKLAKKYDLEILPQKKMILYALSNINICFWKEHGKKIKLIGKQMKLVVRRCGPFENLEERQLHYACVLRYFIFDPTCKSASPNL